MQEWLSKFLVFAQAQPLWLGLCSLMAAAGLEYVLPPFPGDSVVLAGAVLVPLANWPGWMVFSATLLGSLLGAALDWWVGRWIVENEHRETWLHRWLARESVAPRVERLLQRFRDHGSVYIALNRFLPAFRSLFFVTAGMARLPLGRVLFFAGLSAAAWNGCIFAAGYAVGYNLERLLELADQYNRLVWVLLVLALVVWLAVKYRRGGARTTTAEESSADLDETGSETGDEAAKKTEVV